MGAAGKVKWNVAPRPPSPLAQIRPPCDSMIDLLIARPIPLPCGFVVKNASNIWSALPKGRISIRMPSQRSVLFLCVGFS